MIFPPGRLPPSLQRTLAARGHTRLTPVQQAVLEALPAAGDLLISAPTGSGKTVAFGIALAVTLGDAVCAAMAGFSACGLVIAPTRELAQQVCSELRWLLAETGLRTVCVTGGGNEALERSRLRRGGSVVVGTPGRLSAHVAGGALDLSRCRMVVIDEADEMLALGFRAELDALLALPKAPTRVMLLSATVPAELEQIARRYQTRQLRLDLPEGRAACPGFDLSAVEIIGRDRDAALVNLLRFHDPRAAVIFCNRRASVAVVAARLAAKGFRVVTLSGALPQPERQAALEAMRSGAARVCVATDLAARGLDLPGLDLVLNADVPSGSQVLAASLRPQRAIRPAWPVNHSGDTARAGPGRGVGMRGTARSGPGNRFRRRIRFEERISRSSGPIRASMIHRTPRPGRWPRGSRRSTNRKISRLRRPGSGAPCGPIRYRWWHGSPVPRAARWFEVAADGDDPDRMGDVVSRVSQLAGVPRSVIGRIHVGPERVCFEVTGGRREPAS